MTLASIDRLPRLTPAQATSLRERLAAAGYDGEAIERGEAIAPAQVDVLRLPLVHDELALDDCAASDLALIFAYRADLPRARAERALTADLTALALDLGIVTANADGTLRSPFILMPFLGIWLLSDPLSEDGDAVMGPGATTGELVQALPQRCPPAVLDMGCGAGTLALLAAARGCAEAVGVDINARAIEMAAFNATLNGLAAEFIAGDMFAPVAARRFDLMISQPPFVARPPGSDDAVFLYGGALGDEFALALVAQTPAHLKPDGRAVILLDTPVLPDRSIHARVRAALGDAPVDLAVFTVAAMSPDMMSLGYTARTFREVGEYNVAVRRHRAHLRALGIKEFSHALVLLLAPGGRFTIALPVRSLRALDAASLDLWAEAIALASGDEAALRAATLRPAPGLVFVEERTTPDRSVVPTWRVHATKGVATSRELSEASWALLEAVATSATLDEAIDLYAEVCDAQPAEVRPQVLGFVREQLAKGLLVKASAE